MGKHLRQCCGTKNKNHINIWRPSVRVISFEQRAFSARIGHFAVDRLFLSSGWLSFLVAVELVKEFVQGKTDSLPTYFWIAVEGHLSTLCLRATGAVAEALKSFHFEALNGTVSVMDRRVAYHQTHDVFIPSRIKTITSNDLPLICGAIST